MCVVTPLAKHGRPGVREVRQYLCAPLASPRVERRGGRRGAGLDALPRVHRARFCPRSRGPPRGVCIPERGLLPCWKTCFKRRWGEGRPHVGAPPTLSMLPHSRVPGVHPAPQRQATLDRGQVSGGTVRTGSPQPRASGRGARPSSAGVGSLPSLGAPSAAHESHRPKYTQSCLHRLSLHPRLTSLFEIAIHGIYL